MQERGLLQQTHRYYSIPHQMKVLPPIHDGEYLNSSTRQTPPKELTEAIGSPVSPAMQVTSQLETE
jgi:NAD(P)H-quinone oxidoreductase subunit K